MKTNRITRSNLTRNIAALLATAGAFTPIVSHAASGSWVLTTGGAWGTAANWNPAAVPGSAAGDVITIGTNIAVAAAITLDANRTVGTLNMGDSDSTHAFTISAASALILDQTASGTALVRFGAAGATAGIINGIASTITLNDNARFYTTLTASQTLSGIISGAKALLFDNDDGTTLAGPVSNQGQFTLSGVNTYSLGTTIDDVRVNISTSSLALGAAGSAVVIQDGGQVFNSTGLTTINYAFNIAGNGWLEAAGQLGALRLDSGATVTGTVAMSANASIGSNSGTGTVSGIVSGAGFTLSKRGAGTLVLSGANNYSGGTDVTAGILQANSNAAFGSGAVTISGATSRTLLNGGVTLGNNFTINVGVIGTAGVGLIGQTGTGQATVNGSITLNSVPTSGGTFHASNNVGSELVLAGPISGTLGASQRDGRVIYKNASSTATGSLNVTGTALAGVTNGIPVGWNVLLGGSASATLDLNGFDQALAGLTIGNATAANAFIGTVSLGAKVLTLNGDITGLSNIAQNVTHAINATAGGGLNTGASARTINLPDTVAADDLAISGAAITGAGGIIKTGAGALALNGVTLTGPLVVNVGTLATGKGAQIGSITAPSVAFAAGTTLRMKAGAGGDLLGGGIVTTAGTTVRLHQVGGILPIGTYPIINFTGTAPTIGAGGLTLAAVGHSTSSLIYVGNSVALDVTANDKVIWDGTATTAWTTAATGNWKLAMPLTPTDYIESDDVVFQDLPTNPTVAIATNVSPSNVAFTNTAATAYTVNGPAGISGSTGLTVSGGGIVTLTNPNTYSGATNVTLGTLNLTGGSLNGSNVTVASGTTFAATGAISGAGVTFTTSGTSSIAGANNYTGATSVLAGTLTMTAGTLAGSNVTVAPGATFTQSGGVISGLGTALTTSGTTTLAGVNTFNGDVFLNGGLLSVAMTNGVTGNLGTSINTGTTSKTVFITNNGVFRNTSALFNDNTGSGTTLQVVFNIGSGGGTFDTPAATQITLDDNSAAGNAQNAAQLQGTGTLTKTGDGILSLGNLASNYGTFTGAIFINAGTLTTGTTSTNPFGTTTLGTTIASGATLDVKAAAIGAEPLTITGTGFGGVGALISSVTGGSAAGPITLAGDASVGGATALGLSGVIGGGFSLTKVGAGTTTLSNAANAYTGTTTFAAGQVTASVVGALPTTTALIFNGGTLDPSNLTHTVPSISGASGSINQGTAGTGVVKTTQTGTTVFQGTVNRVTVDMSGSGSLSLGGVLDNNTASLIANAGVLVLAKGDTGVVSQAIHTVGGSLNINSGGTVQLGGAYDNITTPGTGVNLAPVGINTATYVDQIYNSAIVNLNLGGTLDLNGRQEAVSNLTHSGALGGTVTNTSATAAKLYIGHQGGSSTFAGVIENGTGGGGVSVEKVGAGTVTWTGAHTFTGSTVISGGQLNVLTNLTTSPVIVADGGSLGGEASITNVTLGTATTGNVAFEPNTVGALTVGTLTVNGTASTVDFSVLPTGAGPWTAINYTTLAGTGTIGFANAASYRVAPSVVTGGGLVTVNVTGTKALAWTGTGAVTTVWDNNVNTNWADITPSPDNFFAGDTVTFGDGPTVVGVTVTSGVTPWKTTVNSATNNYTLTSTTNGIAGGGNLEKSGASVLTLVGPNTYSGKTIISLGTLAFPGATSLGNATATNSIAISGGGRLSYNAATAADLGATRGIAVGTGGGSISHNNATAATITVSGDLTNSGADTLSFHSNTTGGGTFLLSGVNSSYTGNISLNATSTGLTTLNLSTASAVPNAASITINYPAAAITTGNANTVNLNGVTLPVGTTLNMTAFLSGAISQRSQITSQGNAAINGPTTLTGNAGSVVQFAPNVAGSTLTINGNITEATPGSFGTAGSLGVLFLRNNGLTVVNGTINLPNAMISRVDATGSATINSTGNVWAASDVRAATTLRIGANNALAIGAYLNIGQVADNSASLFDLNGFSQEVNGLTSLIGTASNGRAVTNSSATPGTLTINSANNYTFGNSTGFTGGNLTGNLSLVKTGIGTQTIAGPANTYTGNVTVNGGTLIAGGGPASTALGNPTLAGRTVTANNAGTILNLTTNNVFGNGIGNLNLPATILNSGTTLTTNSYNVLGELTLNGATLAQSVTGNVNYEGFQFRGNVTVGGAAVSTISTSTVKPNHLGANTVFNVANATGNAATDLLVSAALRNQSGDFTLAAGGLTKTGNGTMELSAAVNSYTGATVVDAGKLIVNGSISGSAVTVNAAGILGGNAITGALTVAGGTLAPGNSVGTVTTPTLTLSGGVYAVEMTGASVNDQIIVSTAASITANTALTLDFSTFDPVDFADTFTIILNNGASPVGTTGLFTYNGTPLNSNDRFNATSGAFSQDFTITYAGGDGNDVVLTAVPEPGSVILLLGGFSSLVCLQRRRRNA